MHSLEVLKAKNRTRGEARLQTYRVLSSQPWYLIRCESNHDVAWLRHDVQKLAPSGRFVTVKVGDGENSERVRGLLVFGITFADAVAFAAAYGNVHLRMKNANVRLADGRKSFRTEDGKHPFLYVDLPVTYDGRQRRETFIL